MGGHAGKPRCEVRPADGLARGACCVCAVSPDVAGLSHSGRGSRHLKLVSDGWGELLRTGSRPPGDTRAVKRSLVRPSAVRVPESTSLGWPGVQKRAVCWRRCSGGATVTRPPSPLGDASVGVTVDRPVGDAGGELGLLPGARDAGGLVSAALGPVLGEAVRGAGCWVRCRQWPQPREQRLLSSQGCSSAGPCTHG